LDDVQELFNSFTTVESYSISRLKTLYDYLLDLSIDFPLSKNDILFEKKEIIILFTIGEIYLLEFGETEDLYFFFKSKQPTNFDVNHIRSILICAGL
jgi:hypothetical protein